MMITKNNYEAFILDYLEGQLSEESKSGLFRFLDEHPDLAAELDIDLDGLPQLTEKEDEVYFPELKAVSSEMPQLIDEKLAAALEGDIEFPITSGNSLLEKHWKAMQFTKLPVERVSNGSKNDLKVEGVEDQQSWLAAIAEGDVADGLLKSAALNDANLSHEIAQLKKAILLPESLTFGDLRILKREPKVIPLFPLFSKFAKYAAVAAAVIAAIAWFSLTDVSMESTLYQAYNGGPNVSRSINTISDSAPASSDEAQETSTVFQYAAEPSTPALNRPLPKVNISFAKQIQPKGVDVIYTSGELVTSLEASIVDHAANTSPKMTNTNASKIGNYVALKEFVLGKAKDKVLGEAYQDPESSFVRALTDKLEKSIEEKNRRNLRVQLPNKKKGQRFYFKLGKVEINKPSGIIEFIHGAGNANS
ncbi:MAG: hypothetical protein ACJAU0_000681 [Flavobacteriales bacterium]|jgi:hypothetical protein